MSWTLRFIPRFITVVYFYKILSFLVEIYFGSAFNIHILKMMMPWDFRSGAAPPPQFAWTHTLTTGWLHGVGGTQQVSGKWEEVPDHTRKPSLLAFTPLLLLRELWKVMCRYLRVEFPRLISAKEW